MNAIRYPMMRVQYRRRGLGQTSCQDANGNPVDCGDPSALLTTCTAASQSECPPGTTWIYSPSPFPSTTTPSAQPGGASTTTQPINWGQIIGNLITTAGKTAQTAISPLSNLTPGTTYYSTPQGTLVSTAGGATNALATANIAAYMPLILLAGGAVALIMLIQGASHR